MFSTLLRPVAQALAASGYAVVIPDYRLYPSVRFPAFIDDGARAVATVSVFFFHALWRTRPLEPLHRVRLERVEVSGGPEMVVYRVRGCGV